MATYAIGDVQGCFASLEKLLKLVHFSPASDTLWFVGDLVNRGPRSLDVLRFLMDLGDGAVAVLGNHDLHLLARIEGIAVEKNLDTLDDVLEARDVDKISEWLCRRPLMHRERGFALVHAGLLPGWTLDEAQTHASLLGGRLLQKASRRQLLADRKKTPALRALTTIRTCYQDGSLSDFSGAPSDAPSGCKPWFQWPTKRNRQEMIVFGHWSALGLHQGEGVIGLDTGCVWGGALTALRMEDGKIFQQPGVEGRRRG